MHYGKLRKILVTSLFFFFGIALISYAYYQSRSFLSGPQIEITSPEDGSTFEDPLISIDGNAYNIARITLNDRQIFVDENGNFSEKLLLLEGYNIITVYAEDKFDRSTRKELELVLIEEKPLSEAVLEDSNKDEDDEENQS